MCQYGLKQNVKLRDESHHGLNQDKSHRELRQKPRHVFSWLDASLAAELRRRLVRLVSPMVSCLRRGSYSSGSSKEDLVLDDMFGALFERLWLAADLRRSCARTSRGPLELGTDAARVG